jgi:pSer/pThr/pTyr-binding forkhead associated (FHA) protein
MVPRCDAIYIHTYLSGVFVNGRRIDTHVLNDGDVVQVSGSGSV